MNYDYSISSEVSLSKVLDEMILDRIEFEVVIQFLKSHESQIPDMYTHSAYVYDLYDLAIHSCRINNFLIKHIESLPAVDMCFAVESLANFLVSEDIYPEIMRNLRRMFRGDDNIINFRAVGYKGRLLDDIKVASGNVDFFKLVEAISSDKRDVKTFLRESYLARSMLMANNFIHFSAQTQFIILSSLKEIISSPYSKKDGWKILVAATTTLLKQLLVANETEMFNWVVSVLELNTCGYIKNELRHELFAHIPTILSERLSELHSFEEVVFEMNMMETQFDVLDLFIYIYFFDNNYIRGMRENLDLLEFFNLPFKWENLDKLKIIIEDDDSIQH